MKINGRQTVTVNIDPLEVLENLYYKVLGGYGNWVRVKADDTKVIMCEQSTGQHSSEAELRKISEDEYEYIISLQNVLKHYKKFYN